MHNTKPFNKGSIGLTIFLVILIGCLAGYLGTELTKTRRIGEPTTTTATFVQCWSSGVEIYSATVGSHIHRTENTVHFDTDYGSVTIMGDCVLTELMEKEATND